MRFLVGLIALAGCLSACGALPELFSKKVILPAAPVELDMSALTDDMFAGASPVGVITMNFKSSKGDMMSFCTAFLISSTRVLTNHHCIYDDEAGHVTTNDKLTMYLRKRNDKETSVFKVKSILGYDSVDAESPSDRKNILDWALVELEKSAKKFGVAEIAGDWPSLEEVTTNIPVTVARINPPDFDNGVRTAVFDPKPSEVDTSQRFTYEAKSSASLAMRDNCRSTKAFLSAEYRECDKLTVTDEQIYEELKQEKTESLVRTAIRHGNSGSPVIFNGKVLGLAHSGIYPVGTNESSEVTRGLMQFIFPIADKIR